MATSIARATPSEQEEASNLGPTPDEVAGNIVVRAHLPASSVDCVTAPRESYFCIVRYPTEDVLLTVTPQQALGTSQVAGNPSTVADGNPFAATARCTRHQAALCAAAGNPPVRDNPVPPGPSVALPGLVGIWQQVSGPPHFAGDDLVIDTSGGWHWGDLSGRLRVKDERLVFKARNASIGHLKYVVARIHADFGVRSDGRVDELVLHLPCACVAAVFAGPPTISLG